MYKRDGRKLLASVASEPHPPPNEGLEIDTKMQMWIFFAEATL